MTQQERPQRRTPGTWMIILIVCILAAVSVGVTVFFYVRTISGSAPVRFDEAKDLKKNDLVSFGSYEQDGDKDNGPEAIEWIVLDVQDDRALLLSRYVLLPIPFHDVYEDTTWEECSSRTYLNETFRSEAFSSDELERIAETKNANHANEALETHGCGSTRDYVFLLSLEEAKAYLRTDEDRALTGSAEPTHYAELLHIETQDETAEEPAKSCWWLRTPGTYQYSAAFVNRDGTIYENGAVATHETYCGMRPAVWVIF